MLYWTLKYIVYFAFRAYFKRIYISGAHHIPKNKPVILASNHPNSFLDAIVMGVLLRRPVHFLARGDVFNTPFKKWLLWQIKMLPIYRMEEGMENLHKNEETFAKCDKILSNNGIILIFSEGLCIIEKRLRKLRKGTARIAFTTEAESGWTRDIQVVPVGLNYQEATQARTRVMMAFDAPIQVKSFQEVYDQNPAIAIRQFNEQLTQQLRQLVIHVADRANDTLAEQILEIRRNDWASEGIGAWLRKQDDNRKKEWEAIEALNALSVEEQEALKTASNAYFKQLKKLGLKDKEVQRRPKNRIGKMLLVLLVSPIALMGWLGNVGPWLLAQKITRKVVKSNVFTASVSFGAALFLYIIYYILFGIAFSYLPIPFYYFGLLMLSSYVTIQWMETWRELTQEIAGLRFSAKQPSAYEQLKKERRQLHEILQGRAVAA
ncbi:1-acyl-sn-glycerol-3-phosphate acyltransferase [Cytophagales bacterium LB-30]|uniref:1-acyl-sn-glycerol-3-phosphate acyltransferase n=1 Tax=Shiella aurantiaca TaxID=3058365 RepID=A0ABT8F395_9BACT|nr:1-acyl-sn-glycerol-3-phosphate acyltransferase [Shiella aurantiaca]MDN4164925.1 1-acyl-sn-glycerol-3-phosphate acyltransferase [Shiella aurantiaca]